MWIFSAENIEKILQNWVMFLNIQNPNKKMSLEYYFVPS